MFTSRSPLPAALLERLTALEPRPYTGRPINSTERLQRLTAILAGSENTPGRVRLAELLATLKARRECADLA